MNLHIEPVLAVHVKQLRERTGMGMVEAKRFLQSQRLFEAMERAHTLEDIRYVTTEFFRLLFPSHPVKY